MLEGVDPLEVVVGEEPVVPEANVKGFESEDIAADVRSNVN